MLIRVAGFCGITSQVIGLITLLVVISQSPWFSWTDNDLSVLGVMGSARHVFNFGLILVGALSFIFAIGLGKSFLSEGRLGRAGIASLVLGSVAVSAMGIFPRNIDIPHDSASLAFFIFTPIAIFLFGIRAVTIGQKIWGNLSLSAAILMICLQLIPWPWPRGAIPQLLSGLSWSIWTSALSINLLVKSISPKITRNELDKKIADV
ncbi:MAG: DUF998 domain-containing protein [Dehalococcoidia bacterium]|nr:MAG: DUF998 domain-containing protein [Dehalococcoidia bacterium]